MRKLRVPTLLLLVALSLSTVSLAQQRSAGVGDAAAKSGNEYLQKQNALDRLDVVNPNTATFGIPLPPASLEGDFYLESNFREGKFELTVSPKLYEDFQLRYDIKNNLIEINYEDGVRGLDGDKVKFFELKNASGVYVKHINVRELEATGEAIPQNTFLEVVIDDKIPLYRFEKLTIKRADYNVALNVGNRNDQIIKKPVYLSVANGIAYEIKKGKKSDIFKLLPSKETELRAYAKENKIKIKNLEDYMALINKINSMN